MTSTTRSGGDEYRVALRRGVFVAELAAALVVLLGFVRFPNWQGPLLSVVAIAFVIVAVLWGIGFVALLQLRGPHPHVERAVRAGVAVGLGSGFLWLAYILFSHLALPDRLQPTVGSVLTNITLAVTALGVLVASGYGAWRARQVLSGLSVGLWAGTLAGLIAFLTVEVMLLVGMGFLVQHMNSGEVEAFVQSGWHDRASWYYWQEELFGSVGYFLTLVIGCLVLGGIGGVVGKLLALARGSAQALLRSAR